MKTAIKLVLIYFLMQLFGALTAGPLSVLYVYLTAGVLNVDEASRVALAPTLLLGFVYMLLYLWKQDYLKDDGCLYTLPSVPTLLWSVVAGVSSIFLLSALMSVLKFLPDWMDQTFDVLQTGSLGIFCIALFGPVLEELLFRGAITKVLLQKYRPATAILLSGLVFGVFHINPAQVVGACLMGFLLAWLYYRTNSLLPGILVHVLNNGSSVYLSLNYPDVQEVADLMDTVPFFVCLALSLLLLAFSLRILNRNGR